MGEANAFESLRRSQVSRVKFGFKALQLEGLEGERDECSEGFFDQTISPMLPPENIADLSTAD